MFEILDQQFSICEGDLEVAEGEAEIAAGMVVSLNNEGKIVIFRNTGSDYPFGIAGDDFDELDDDIKDMPLTAKRKISVYRGGIWAKTDQFDMAQSYIPGSPLYAGTSSDGVTYGQLTTVIPEHNKTVVGIVIKHHPSKNVLECSLKI